MEGILSICSNSFELLNKIASMPIYDKKHIKISRTEKASSLFYIRFFFFFFFFCFFFSVLEQRKVSRGGDGGKVQAVSWVGQ